MGASLTVVGELACFVMVVAMANVQGGCHLLFPFEHQLPAADVVSAADGGGWDLRRDRPITETAPQLDGSAVDAPWADAAPPAPDSAADAGPVKISPLLKSTQKTSCDSTDTAGGLAPAGVCTIEMTLINSATVAIRPRHFLVVKLTNNNLLLTADGGPAGAGATLTVPAGALGADGKLTPGESFKQSLKIGLKTSTGYQFYVDVYGDVLP